MVEIQQRRAVVVPTIESINSTAKRQQHRQQQKTNQHNDCLMDDI